MSQLTIPKEQLRREINEILKNSDLETTSSKVVRTKLEQKLSIDLSAQKKELDKLIMQCVNAMNSSESEESEHSEPEKPAKKKRPAASSDEEDYKPAVKTKKKKKQQGSDDSGSDDWQESKKKNKKGQKYTGFTRPYKLSPELSSLMGKKEMPRHEVVKKVWSIIKEKNLYDPNNKQYAICDKELEKVIGVKRFRTFGMMKYLSPHLIK